MKSKGLGYSLVSNDKGVIEILKPNSEMEISEETVRTAKKAFPKGSLYITLRDKLGPIFEDREFAYHSRH